MFLVSHIYDKEYGKDLVWYVDESGFEIGIFKQRARKLLYIVDEYYKKKHFSHTKQNAITINLK